jgi:hypothetical protein
MSGVIPMVAHLFQYD